MSTTVSDDLLIIIIIITVTVRSSGKLSHVRVSFFFLLTFSMTRRYVIVNNIDDLLSRRKLLIHMEKARDHGYLDVDCPAVDYDYNDYIQQYGN